MLVNMNEIMTKEEMLYTARIRRLREQRDLLALPQEDRELLAKRRKKQRSKWEQPTIPFSNTGVENTLNGGSE